MRESKNSTKKFGLKQWFAGLLALLMIVTALPVSGLSGALTAEAANTETVDVYRAYNPYSYGHLWTTDANEYAVITTTQGWNAEGVKWEAPKTSSTPVYRLFNPNTDEHLLALAGEANALSTIGWNNEGIAFYSDDAKGVPIYRVNNPNEDGPASHHFCDQAEGAALVARGYKWDNGGQPMIYGVSAGSDDNAEVRVTLSVDKTPQADGTYLYTDTPTISVAYGAELGTPDTVIWYRDKSAVQVQSLSASGLSTNAFQYTAGTAQRVGTYYVTIKNTEGKTYRSENEIVVVKNQERAEILEFSIEDDYETGVNASTGDGASEISYDTEDKKAIVTVSLNKAYDGIFKIYEASDEEYATAIGTAKDTSKSSAADGFATESKSLAKVTNAAVSGTATEKGIKFEDKETGVVTYRYVINADSDTGFTRGTDYVITFDQANVDDDTPGADGASVNQSEPFAAPYVEAPAYIEVSKRQNGQEGEVTSYDEDGNALLWLSASKSEDVGITAGVLYQETGVAKAKGTTSALKVDSDATRAGVTVFTTNGAIDSTTNDYFWATLTFKKGVFGEDALTLESDIIEKSAPVSGTITIAQDSTDAKKANITVNTIKADGTLYLVKDSDFTTTTAATTAEAAIAKKAVGSVEVSKGETTFALEDTLNAAGTFNAVIIPADEVSYERTTGTVTLDPKPTTFALSEVKGEKATSNDITATGALTAKDQWGQPITTFTTELASGVVMKEGTSTTLAIGTDNDEDSPTNGPKLTISDDDGNVTIDSFSSTGQTNVTTGMSWVATTSYGTFTLSVADAGDGTTGADGAESGVTFVLTFAAK